MSTILKIKIIYRKTKTIRGLNVLTMKYEHVSIF